MKLKPCPFCENEEPYIKQVGTRFRSTIIACDKCGSRHESSDKGEQAGKTWNQRAYEGLPAAAQQLAMRAKCSNLYTEGGSFREITDEVLRITRPVVIKALDAVLAYLEKDNAA